MQGVTPSSINDDVSRDQKYRADCPEGSGLFSKYGC